MTPKKKIITESIQLFATKGFDATSVREIALKAEVNIAMISYYFKSKQGILVEIINEIHEKQKYMQELVIQLDISAYDKLQKILEQTINFAVNEFNELKVLSTELRMNHRAEVVEKMKELNQYVKNFIKNLIQDINSSFSDEEADFIAIAMIATIFEIIINPSSVHTWKNKIPFYDLSKDENKVIVKEYLYKNLLFLTKNLLY